MLGLFYYIYFMTIEHIYTHFLKCDSISTDTRKITKNCMFFALNGENFNGNTFAEKALEKDTGARALRAIIEEFMLDIMYEIPKDDNIGRVTITKEYLEGCGGPRIEMRGSRYLEVK